MDEIPTADNELVFGVSDFVAVCNQTLEFAYPSVVIMGEVSSFKVSKNRWVYFDLKDEFSRVRFFGTVYDLPGPIEDGMMVRVRGAPRLHPQFGFSVTFQSIQPVGEGSIKKAASLLKAKLETEGLFDPARKRPLPYPPQSIGLVASGESAAYADFIKILNQRWVGVEILHADVQVQGESAPVQIIRAVQYFNELADPPDVLVITRGGGSADDLAAFDVENVVRAIAASRVPTLVAIGHEIDISLSELAADSRASTPSNAAELLVPDKKTALSELVNESKSIVRLAKNLFEAKLQSLEETKTRLNRWTEDFLAVQWQELEAHKKLIAALSPIGILARGYAIISSHGSYITRLSDIKGDEAVIKMQDGTADVKVGKISIQKGQK